MLLNFVQWIQLTDFFTALRGSAYIYPIVLSLHMVGLALFGGMILMTDLRLLGVTMRQRSIADVVNQLRVPKRWGLLLTATCGFLMFGSKAEEYYYNAFFRTKLILFAVVIVTELVFYRSGSRKRETGGGAFAAAVDIHRMLRARHRLHRAAARQDPRPDPRETRRHRSGCARSIYSERTGPPRCCFCKLTQ
jgi:hypothetical protein